MKLGWTLPEGLTALFLAPLAAGLVLVLLPMAGAQPLPSADLLQQLQQLQQQQGQQNRLPQTDNQPAVPADLVIPQALPGLEPANMPPTRLEQIMSARAGTQLKQFGYQQLGVGRNVTVPQMGALQDNYVLGPGDQIAVTLRGQETRDLRGTVDRNGQVVLPNLNPIAAGGRTFGSFREEVERAVARAFIATTAYVSVVRTRQISVQVSGEVNVPGLRQVTGLSTALDALALSGGVRKSGSLRNIRIQRGARVFNVDLYGVLTEQGNESSVILADGDRIVVPTLGPTVAISGLVRRPGIYELAAGKSSISAAALMALAGGEEVGGNFRRSLLRILPDGRSQLDMLKDLSAPVGNSEVLSVQLDSDQTIGQVMLSGGTRLAGSFPIGQGSKLSQIIKKPGTLPQTPYTLFGVISRKDPRTLMQTLVAFTPVAVLSGREDIDLQPDDTIRPFSMKELQLLVSIAHDYLQSQEARQEALRNPNSVTEVNGRSGYNGSGTILGDALRTTANTEADAAAAQENTIQLLGTRQSSTLPYNGPVSPMQQPNVPNGSAFPNDAASRTGTSTAMGAPNPNGAPTVSGTTIINGAPTTRMLVTSQNGGDLAEQLAPDFQDRISVNGGYPPNREAVNFNQVAQQLAIDPLILVNFLIDHQVTLAGAVRGPGTYLVGPSAALQDLVAAAGGTVNWVDASGVELISTTVDSNTGRSSTQQVRLPLTQSLFASYVVKPRDEFRFNQVFTDADLGSVTLQGEVRFSGSYRLIRGERLSDLLNRAGGLTAAAYPSGAVFLRKSVAVVERDGYLRAAKEVEDQLVAAMTRVGNGRIDPAVFTSMQSFVNDLRNQKPVGRISVIADPSQLAAHPELDPMLEPDDVIYIPVRPSTVSVLGQVMQAGNFTYRTGESVNDYIRRAGGFTQSANESEVFVVLPDGTARRVEKSWLRFDRGDTLPPGSAIVVPRDLTPFDLRQTIIDVSQILSQFAVSIASVAVISRN